LWAEVQVPIFGWTLGWSWRGQRGSIVVEAGLVLPLLTFLLLGVIEVGGVIKSYSSAANAVRAGGRMASVAGNDASADQQVLARMARESTALSDGELDFVILWHATGPGDTVPAGCVTIAQSSSTANTTSLGVSDGGTDAVGACNVYIRPQASGGAFDMASGDASNPPDYYFGCSGGSDPGAGHRLDCRWPAQNRKTVISPRVLPPGSTEAQRLRPDYVGVYMQVSHNYLSGILGNVRTITDSSINLLEPSNYGVGT
jgi:Flp pilus assembly protein TadG